MMHPHGVKVGLVQKNACRGRAWAIEVLVSFVMEGKERVCEVYCGLLIRAEGRGEGGKEG